MKRILPAYCCGLFQCKKDKVIIRDIYGEMQNFPIIEGSVSSCARRRYLYPNFISLAQTNESFLFFLYYSILFLRKPNIFRVISKNIISVMKKKFQCG